MGDHRDNAPAPARSSRGVGTGPHGVPGARARAPGAPVPGLSCAEVVIGRANPSPEQIQGRRPFLAPAAPPLLGAATTSRLPIALPTGGEEDGNNAKRLDPLAGPGRRLQHPPFINASRRRDAWSLLRGCGSLAAGPSVSHMVAWRRGLIYLHSSRSEGIQSMLAVGGQQFRGAAAPYLDVMVAMIYGFREELDF